MLVQCQEVARRAGLKLKTLLRTRRFFNLKEMVILYKSHVLPVLEFSTPAVFHASSTVLELLDKVQRRFLREVGLSEEDALLHFNLAPLECRRDMAVLGLIHRTVLNKGPPHFQQWFFPDDTRRAYNTRHQTSKHNKQLYDYIQGNHTELLRRSILGQARVYNKLPQRLVDAKTIKNFQHKLQQHLKTTLRTKLLSVETYDRTTWVETYSGRLR